MKSTSFEWMPYWDISVYLAKPGDRIKLGTGSDYTVGNLWGQSVIRINEDGTSYFFFVFNPDKPPTVATVAHECWHMFFQLLTYQGELPLSMVELQKEIYAMAYESLFIKVLQSLSKLGVYKEEV